jgi:zinc transporter 9
MSNIFSVTMMSLGMFALTTIIGLLPTHIKAKKSTMDLISIFGAGLLVGAALIVIVPEGMVVLVESYLN